MFREVVRKKQALPKETCVELLKTEKRGVLSVLGDGGYPYGLPIDHWYNEEDGCLYFHSGKTGHKVEAMKACNKASFCVYDQGYREEGDWALHIQSVIVFGRLEVVENHDHAIALTRQLSFKYTQDGDYIEDEIRKYGHELLCFKLVPEHMTGKIVKES